MKKTLKQVNKALKINVKDYGSAIAVAALYKKLYSEFSEKIGKQIIECFKRGNKVLVFGNGGSLADASHWAAEFHGIGPVIALNDPAKITSIGNDYEFDVIFSKQIQDIGKQGDLAIGISSSGKSQNIINALARAELEGLNIIDFPRKGKNTQEVQEYQYKLLHDVYLLVKKSLAST